MSQSYQAVRCGPRAGHSLLQDPGRSARNGNIVSEARVSKGKLRMAENYDRKAEQEQVKIEGGQGLD
jgi:hypothetical protein